MKYMIRGGVFLTLLAGVGCESDPRAPVSGKITVNGKAALPGGSIQFVSVSDPNRVGGGQIKPDGTYEVHDAPVGECKVMIDNTHLDPGSKAAALPGMPGPGGMQGMKGMPGMPGRGAPVARGPKASDKSKMGTAPTTAEVPPEMSASKDETMGMKYQKIDLTYSKAESTPLKVEITSGSNTHNFDVK